MILFFGPPGSGKSVQGDLLVKRNGWQWLSTGQIFRESKDAELQKRLASGELIDNELTNKILNNALMDAAKGVKVVLDGYPRNVDQAQWLIDNLPNHGREIACVLEFDVPKEELVSRMIDRGRAEDTEDVIVRRLDIYQQKTRPVLEFYRERGVPIVRIDGIGTPEEVHERIQEAVETCLQK
jgi:adenylate kinase